MVHLLPYVPGSFVQPGVLGACQTPGLPLLRYSWVVQGVRRGTRGVEGSLDSAEAASKAVHVCHVCTSAAGGAI